MIAVRSNVKNVNAMIQQASSAQLADERQKQQARVVISVKVQQPPLDLLQQQDLELEV